MTSGVFPDNLEAWISPGCDFHDSRVFLVVENLRFQPDLISVTFGVFSDNLQAWISPGFDFHDKWSIFLQSRSQDFTRI